MVRGEKAYWARSAFLLSSSTMSRNRCSSTTYGCGRACDIGGLPDRPRRAHPALAGHRAVRKPVLPKAKGKRLVPTAVLVRSAESIGHTAPYASILYR